MGTTPAPRSRARSASWLLVGIAATAMLTGCGGHGTASTASTAGTARTGVSAVGTTVFAPAKRQRLPAIVGKTLSGTTLSLRSLTGRGVVVVNVWASWCANCRDESSAFAASAAALRARGVSFVGLDEQDTATAARSFVRSTGASYPHLVDPDGKLLSGLVVLPTAGIPSTLVVDRRGMMAARITGPASRAQLERVIATVQRQS